MNHPRSQQLFQAGLQVIPGGVNSPVRSFRSVDEDPVFYSRAADARVWDVDGHCYLDFIGSWGPMIFGHRPPEVLAAVAEQLKSGTSFGAPCELEVQIAEKIVSIVPSVEMVRMMSSGTEATMSAIRLARGYTGRDLIIKFAGNYHGHSDSLLVSAGSGLATLAIPGTPGVTKATAAGTLVANYNDIRSVQELFQAYPQEIAAVILEPIAGNMGLVAPEAAFLPDLRELCSQHGALLIFDEVISGFRVALGGAQEVLGVSADLVTYGKIIGGGFPVGCLAGPRQIMEYLAPVGPVYQAGTLSGNPVAMTAGLATLNRLQAEKDRVYPLLDALGGQLESGLNQAISELKIPVCVQRFGSLLTIFFTAGPVTDWASAARSDPTAFKRYFSQMLNAGFLIAPSQFECLFISTAHTPADIDAFIDAAAQALARL